MATQKVVKYATRSVPAKNEWWLALALEDGSKPNGIHANSASDLDALCHLLRHTEAVTFDTESGALETAFAAPGKGE
jgi:hypothetical protein